ncbi:hypothetical protein [Henriciella litoralis]|uniref:hypothetical protein n=1 Tax=Henriciella litoralis TaxID=568102 RepID=UPI00111C57A7|nr:hypothetical protein [Henriciella litoralis]
MKYNISSIFIILIISIFAPNGHAQSSRDIRACPTGDLLKKVIETSGKYQDDTFSAYGVLFWNEVGPSVFSKDDVYKFAISQCTNTLSDSGCNKLDMETPEFADWRAYWDANLNHQIYGAAKPDANTPGMIHPPSALLDWAQTTLDCSVTGGQMNVAGAVGNQPPSNAIPDQDEPFEVHYAELERLTHLTAIYTQACWTLIKELEPDGGKSAGELAERWYRMQRASIGTKYDGCDSVPESLERQIMADIAASASQRMPVETQTRSDPDWCDSTCQRERTIQENRQRSCYVSNGRRICY